MIDGMTEHDHGRALDLANYFAIRCREEASDLLQEAFVRALGGERRCRRGVPLLLFLGGIMKSLASQAVESWKAGHRHAQATDEFFLVRAADQPSPEHVVTSRMDDGAVLAKIRDEVADDYELQLILEGITDGMKGVQLEELIGIDAKALASLQRKFQRRIGELKAERASA